jgi:hypothetical protein
MKYWNPKSELSSDKVDFVRRHEYFTAAAAQTAFVLAEVPIVGLTVNEDTIEFAVNGVTYVKTTDFTLSGSTVTWTDAAFVLELNDEIRISYDVL